MYEKVVKLLKNKENVGIIEWKVLLSSHIGSESKEKLDKAETKTEKLKKNLGWFTSGPIEGAQ